MILLIDNYDSFTFNLVQYLHELNAEVDVRRNDTITVADVRGLKPSRIVISPGPCTPKEAGISVALIKEMAGKVPILGVCLGHQAIGEAFGGRVVRAKTVVHGKTSEIRHDNRTIFRGLPQPMTATRYHSLVVDPRSLPPGLEISATATDPDGTEVIMGLRHKSLPVEGVQVHPESILTAQGKALLGNFLKL